MLAGHSAAALLSFEGPDRYAAVGGLGTRETSFARALGEAEIDTTLFFVGDPALPTSEVMWPGVTMRRWCQWISAYHPRDVYDGEYEKVEDYTASVPRFIAEAIVTPAAARGQRVLVIAEEWQTARAAIALDALLRARNLRSAATILWNANNTYGFERIDWIALQRAATILTVSKYMKFELAAQGVPALVVPNGIREALLDGPPAELVATFRQALGRRPALIKVGRFDPDKNWLQAVDALAELRAAGLEPQLILRGGREAYGDVVLARARERDLRIAQVEADGEDPGAVADALAASDADILNVHAFLPDETLFALYAACDAVLANSGKEPFGLVGLEVMAAGGIAVCGATGEEYAEPFVNAIVCDTDDGRELAQYLRDAYGDEQRSQRMREAGRATAARYTWPTVLETLAHKVAYASGRR
ncbi:MAG: glycosyltransferase family 4 protein [Candidatus Eremiobacteraeota bacterium]|nr:glycosyltransferase family 4 protein [Candidatus Eremiobacteraeota bacterium]